MRWPFWQRCWQYLRGLVAPLPQLADDVWLPALRHYPFLLALSLAEQAKLRVLTALFLRDKEFQGVHGLQVTDSMAVEIAAQACLPLLHWGQPEDALGWYDDFVGIVLHPAPARARRQVVDAAGVVHHYREVLAGEAMSGGPIMLSWPEVRHSRPGSNVLTSSLAMNGGDSLYRTAMPDRISLHRLIQQNAYLSDSTHGRQITGDFCAGFQVPNGGRIRNLIHTGEDSNIRERLRRSRSRLRAEPRGFSRTW